MKSSLRIGDCSVWLLVVLPLLAFGILVGCESDGSSQASDGGEESASGLSEFEQEHGIGPIVQRISLDDQVDQALAERGEDIFATKCESCHRMDTRLVGPPLGDVLERRSPEFVMNFMMNPQEMVREHPVGQELLAEYMMEMPYQNVSEEEARAIVEYFRTQN